MKAPTKYQIIPILLLLILSVGVGCTSAAPPPTETPTASATTAPSPSPEPTSTATVAVSPSPDMTATVDAVATVIIAAITQQSEGSLSEDDLNATIMAVEQFFTEVDGETEEEPPVAAAPRLDVTVGPDVSLVTGQAFRVENNAPVDNFDIALSQGDAVRLEQTTDADGNYAFVDLIPGTYSVSVSYVYGSSANLQCNTFTMTTPLEGSWLSLGATNASGQQLMIAIGPELTVEAGEAVYLDFEFECD